MPSEATGILERPPNAPPAAPNLRPHMAERPDVENVMQPPSHSPLPEQDPPTDLNDVQEVAPTVTTPQLSSELLQNLGINLANQLEAESQIGPETDSPFASPDEHSEKKQGIMSKIFEFFKSGSTLSKVIKFGPLLPLALVALIVKKSSRRGQE